MVIKQYTQVKRIFIFRFHEYNHGIKNLYDSPIIQTLDIFVDFGLLDKVAEMVKGNIPSKTKWRDNIWTKAWDLEKDE